METSLLDELIPEILHAKNYVDFFHPHACHICKRSKLDLIECPFCRMISYCTQKHMMLHHPQHKDICNVITDLNMFLNGMNSLSLSLNEWIEFSKKSMARVRLMLGRDLKAYEKQMFTFAKSCFICHKQNDLNAPCEHCLSVHWCSDHVIPTEHNCSKLQDYFELQKFNMYANNRDKELFSSFKLVEIPELDNMESFVKHYRRKTGIKAPRWTLDDTLLTDDLSGPLTLLYGMIDSRLLEKRKKIFVVHILTGRFMDKRALSAWEIILHAFVCKTTLLIEMIGPELKEESHLMKTCAACIDNVNQFRCCSHSLSYHNYALKRLNVPPNVIVIFDEITSEQVSTNIMQIFQAQNCPLLLTSKSEFEADEIVNKIQEILGLQVTPSLYEKNKFASHRLYRDNNDKSMFFPNQYIIFYSDLNDFNQIIPNRNISSNSSDSSTV